MKITNRNNLPQPLVNVLANDTYSKGPSRISITGLMTPPRIALLRQKYSSLLEEDVSDSIWKILGRAIHTVLEQGADEEHLSEERLFAEMDGWVVSGALDLQHLGGNKVSITDYKFTSAWSVMQEKQDWEDQTNSYAFLVRQAKGWEVEKLEICAIIRDWSRHKAAQDPAYPQSAVVRVPIRIWPAGHAKDYVMDRVRKHREAIANAALGEDLPPCTDDERWLRQSTYAVLKKGGKRAVRVFDHKPAAVEYAASNKDYVVQERPAEPIRCANYCSVSAWCSQYAAWKKEHNSVP